KELIELKEDRRLFAVVIAAPILQLFMLGYAATTDVRDVPVVIADADRSTASRDLVARFAASPNFTIVSVVPSPLEVDPCFERCLDVELYVLLDSSDDIFTLFLELVLLVIMLTITGIKTLRENNIETF